MAKGLMRGYGMNFEIDGQGLLHGDKVEQQIVDKHSGNFDDNQPDMLVMHYTGGSSLDGAVTHLKNPRVLASAHLVLGRDGRIVQLIPFTKKAWHAGKSQYMNRVGINHYSIGIEMDNAGPLRKTGNGFVSDFGHSYPDTEVILATHRNESEARYWHMYSEAQIRCAYELCELFIETYPIQYLVGHEEVAPKRKTDPGPAFPLDKFRDQLLNKRSEDMAEDDLEPILPQYDQGVVTASQLNFRDQPSLHGNLLRDPLPSGTPLKIIRERDGWYEVRVEQTGWVKKDYVRL